ncbi:MAG: riboflavin biosynthesis protein RibD [Deltaproteobacteria bacterium GWA2_54_12]|nr:MAG: riboflavin biosynthesis protein RibD [Deltaproteobacteria bacterium GWA2_54_12]
MAYEPLMLKALALAKKGVGKTSPNPAVGSVVVKGGQVIAKGWHHKAGLPHAEIEALNSAGKNAKGSTLFVTLEPCCHFGKTPPCTDAIIASGIKKVIVGASDPNPIVAGKGVAALRAAGIEVVEGVLSNECSALNESYNKYITKGLPFVTLKLAASLDGRIAAAGGESKWITGIESRKLVHRMRAAADGVMVGSETALKDDPELTVRLASGRNPARVVLDSTLRLPVTSKVFNGVKEGRARLIIFTSKDAPEQRIKRACEAGAEVVKLAPAVGGLPLKRVLKALAERGMTSVLVEGGGKLAASLLKEKLFDALVVFYGPMIIGGDGLSMVAGLGLKGLKSAPRFKYLRVKKAGDDIIIECRP